MKLSEHMQDENEAEEDADVAETLGAVKAIRLGGNASESDVAMDEASDASKTVANGTSNETRLKQNGTGNGREKGLASGRGKGEKSQASKKKGSAKEKPATEKDTQEGQKTAAKKVTKRGPPRGKRVLRPEYDEIWKDVYLAGTEWDQMKQVYDIDWDFDHLDEALTNGDLSGKRVHLFGATEPQLVRMNANDEKGDVVPIPTIIAVVSDAAPPSRVGIKSVQRAEEEIVDMSDLRMEWQPYTPANLAARPSFKPTVSVLACSQRKARLRNMEEAAVHRYDYVLPYFFDPEKQEEVQEETEVQVLADLDGLQAPLMCEFDYEMDELDEFVDEKIEERDDLDKAKHKNALMKAIQDAVKVAKDKYRREKAERRRQIDAIPPEERELIRNTKFIKFYPSNEWPNIKGCQSTYINRYYGKASETRDSFPDDDDE